MSVEQVTAREVQVSFGYQIDKGVSAEGVHVGAWPVGCRSQLPSMVMLPYDVQGAPSGEVSGKDGVRIWIDQAKTGHCNASGVQMFMFRTSGNLFEQTFDEPFTLEGE